MIRKQPKGVAADKNMGEDIQVTRGDPENAALAANPSLVRRCTQTYSTPTETHNPMETACDGALRGMAPEKLTDLGRDAVCGRVGRRGWPTRSA